MTEAEIANIERHRDEAFIECARPLWIKPGWFGPSVGPPVMPLTWIRYHQLCGEQHAVLLPDPGAIDRDALLRTLWVLSPSFSHSRIAWRIYKLRNYLCALINRKQLQASLRLYIIDAFLESGASSSNNAPADSSFPASHLLGGIISCFAKLYSWSRRDILEMPIAQSYQLLNTFSGQGNAAAGQPAFNAVEDRKNGDRLRAKRAAAKQSTEATATP